ncbi:MAG: hypothetical protein V4819_01030 [Verrucomicrobiota bacterium]
MIAEETAGRVLYQILGGNFAEVVTIWNEYFGTQASVTGRIGRGVGELERVVPREQDCVLHGWIDQAVLEIVSKGKLADLREEMADYRANQGGDTGLLALEGNRATILEFSFGRGQAVLRSYQLGLPRQ